MDPPSLLDVRDAVEACGDASGSDRHECFLNYGLDESAVDSYYVPVARMEEAMRDKEAEGAEQARVAARLAAFLTCLALLMKII
ncbi:hypothetical protein FOA52_007651 [Chlamydomonas sp. UWO 241]|nr:hypothetical protein FOA52_007651 [Chlamydomonas sp. UWO 241]